LLFQFDDLSQLLDDSGKHQWAPLLT